MPYTKNNWVDGSAPDLDAANLNSMEAGIAAAPYGPDAAVNLVPVANGSGGWTYMALTDAEIAAGAAISYSKLALAASIKNADIATAAGIVYTKLALAASLKDSDIATAQNLSKLAAVTGTPNGTKFLRDDGSWQVSVSGVIAHATRAASVTTSGGTYALGADILTSDLSFTATGSNDYRATLWCCSISNPGNASYAALKLDGAQSSYVLRATSAAVAPFVGTVIISSPAAGAHTMNFRVWTNGVGTTTALGDVGGSGNNSPMLVTVEVM